MKHPIYSPFFVFYLVLAFLQAEAIDKVELYAYTLDFEGIRPPPVDSFKNHIVSNNYEWSDVYANAIMGNQLLFITNAQRARVKTTIKVANFYDYLEVPSFFEIIHRQEFIEKLDCKFVDTGIHVASKNYKPEEAGILFAIQVEHIARKKLPIDKFIQTVEKENFDWSCVHGYTTMSNSVIFIVDVAPNKSAKKSGARELYAILGKKEISKHFGYRLKNAGIFVINKLYKP